jgi:hypothetical protein
MPIVGGEGRKQIKKRTKEWIERWTEHGFEQNLGIDDLLHEEEIPDEDDFENEKEFLTQEIRFDTSIFLARMMKEKIEEHIHDIRVAMPEFQVCEIRVMTERPTNNNFKKSSIDSIDFIEIAEGNGQPPSREVIINPQAEVYYSLPGKSGFNVELKLLLAIVLVKS